MYPAWEDAVRRCRKCGNLYPLNKDNFGHQPNGSYRYTCRACVRKNVRRHYWQDPQRSIDRTLARQTSNFNASERATYLSRLSRRDGWGCFYCKKPSDDYHIDHKVPVNRGGEHNLDNFVMACMQCNQEKHSKTIDEYREWLRARGEDMNF